MKDVVTVNIDRQLQTQLKAKAAIERKSIKEVVDALVQNWLMEEPKQSKEE